MKLRLRQATKEERESGTIVKIEGHIGDGRYGTGCIDLILEYEYMDEKFEKSWKIVPVAL